uniref:Saccharopine dehydrogenase NADP binding domain-containing protein n=1 Tax=Aplanochytrium stocchinoi TaxID=215587 RepID=A0A6S8CMZ8_9STRA|mmetsp:Transcript_16519/g.19774  ORF Transcript_16519/g.19774 Transcript_16519/m.19774 type:complete len:277 (-) Transcript_16519:852-1682(-)
MSRTYDFTVFGATGFTGEKIAKLLSEKITSRYNGAFKIAISGRNYGKLEKVKATMDDTVSVDILVADVQDENSISEMTRQSSMIINCVGPYRYYGEQIVKSCVENGTHYMDISGEPEFIENMELKYKKAAAENNCFIVSGVGFDSVPADLGCIFTQRQFEHPNIPAYVESFLTVDTGESTGKGAGHYATYESAVMGFANQHKLKAIRKKAGSKRIPLVGGVRPRTLKPFYNTERKAYSIPFPGSDPSIVKRTQYFLHQKVSLFIYLTFSSFCRNKC